MFDFKIHKKGKSAKKKAKIQIKAKMKKRQKTHFQFQNSYKKCKKKNFEIRKLDCKKTSKIILKNVQKMDAKKVCLSKFMYRPRITNMGFLTSKTRVYF